MAATRVYRHDLRCPHCGSNWCPKDGHSRGKQTFRCGDCRYRFTPEGNRHYYPAAVKEQAIDLYCEGNSVAAISRVLEVKLGTVYEWVKKSPVGHAGAGYAGSAAAGAGGGHIL